MVSSDRQVSAEAVSGLAREVEALRRAVRLLAGLPAKVDELAATFAEAVNDVNSRGRRAAEVVPISWLGPAGAADQNSEPAVAWLSEVADWVGRVYLPFISSDRDFPDCWLWHPAVLEELAWLHQAWELAYDSETGSVLAAAEWHDRFRPAAAARIKLLAGDCSLRMHYGPHYKRPIRQLASVDYLPAIAHWWTQARNQSPPVPRQEDLDAGSGYRR